MSMGPSKEYQKFRLGLAHVADELAKVLDESTTNNYGTALRTKQRDVKPVLVDDDFNVKFAEAENILRTLVRISTV